MTGSGRPLIIAHRGACAYLPEHTLEAKALAWGMGADFLEQDVVVTRDERLVVLHDIHIDRVSDVAQRHPGRCREDGRYYVRDFDLDELRSLSVWERFEGPDPAQAVFPERFPARTGHFRIAALEDELTMIAGLNRAGRRSVGIYPEIKRPAWHRADGVDCARLLLATLDEFGYRDAGDAAFVQCFDAAELRRVREELGCRLRLVQLIGENDWQESATDYDQLQTVEGIDGVAAYADAIGPWLRQLYDGEPGSGRPVPGALVERAHTAGLTVHPYTFRADVAEPGFSGFADMLRWFRDELAIDGLFTDFPDLAREAFDALPRPLPGQP